MGIRSLRLPWHKKIVVSFTFSLFVTKAHVNNSYVRRIHKRSNINCEKYVRKYWDLESVILLEETGILLMIGISNLNANDIRNPLLESRIQDSLALPFNGRFVDGDGI